MNNTISNNLKKSKFGQLLINILANKFFPFVVGAIILALYYLGQDIITIYVMAILIVTMVVLLEDLTPLAALLPFLHVMISRQHSPAFHETLTSDYFLQPVIFIQIIILLAICVLTIFYRIINDFIYKRFQFTPTFFSLALFSFILLFNGILAEDYNLRNLLYGGLLAFCFLAVFVLISNNVKCSKQNYMRLAYSFIALSLLILIEFVIFILTDDTIILTDSNSIHTNLALGWGNCNTIGMLLCVCMPAAFLLSCKVKHGWIFFLYGIILAVAAIFTTSRQAMLYTAIILPICLLVSLIKSKKHKGNYVAFGFVLACAATFIILNFGWIYNFVQSLINNIFDANGNLSGSGRIFLYEQAYNLFMENQLLGAGFFAEGFDVAVGLPNVVPLQAHNTFIQLLSACGNLAFLAYCTHRIVTVFGFCVRPNSYKLFTIISISAILITSLVDNHIFYVFPTVIYSALLPFACAQKFEE